MPVTFSFYTLGALSLTGIPLFCGFVSKWSLLSAGAEAGTPAALAGVAALIAAAFLCAVYTISISVRAFCPEAGKSSPEGGVHEAPWQMLLPIGVFAALNILFGLFPGLVTGFIQGISMGVF